MYSLHTQYVCMYICMYVVKNRKVHSDRCIIPHCVCVCVCVFSIWNPTCTKTCSPVRPPTLHMTYCAPLWWEEYQYALWLSGEDCDHTCTDINDLIIRKMSQNTLTPLCQVFHKFCLLWVGHGFAKVWKHLRDAVDIWSCGYPCQAACSDDAELPWTAYHPGLVPPHLCCTHLCQHFHL